MAMGRSSKTYGIYRSKATLVHFGSHRKSFFSGLPAQRLFLYIFLRTNGRRLRFWLPTWVLGGQVTFFIFFELWAVLGPKCPQELPQESPEPPQVSIFTDLGQLFIQILLFFGYRDAVSGTVAGRPKASG